MKDRLACLNFIKIIAIIFIACFYHFYIRIHNLQIHNPEIEVRVYSEIVETIISNGWMLVEMMFIISGILFTIAYGDKIRNSEIGFTEFIKKRVLRLYPLVWITVFCSAINIWLLVYNGEKVFEPGIWSFFLSMLTINPAFLAGFPPTQFNNSIWYIGILMVCYIIGFIICKLQKNNNTVLTYLIPIIVGWCIYYSGGKIEMFFINGLLARGLTSFFLGAVLGEILKLDKYDKFYWKLALGILVFLAIIYSLLGSKIIDVPIYICEFLIYPSIIFLVVCNKFINRLCSLSVFAWLAKISFGIYLWNLVLRTIIFDVYHPKFYGMGFYIVIVLIHIIWGSLSYYLLEKPIKKYTDRL